MPSDGSKGMKRKRMRFVLIIVSSIVWAIGSTGAAASAQHPNPSRARRAVPAAHAVEAVWQACPTCLVRPLPLPLRPPAWERPFHRACPQPPSPDRPADFRAFAFCRSGLLALHLALCLCAQPLPCSGMPAAQLVFPPGLPCPSLSQDAAHAQRARTPAQPAVQAFCVVPHPSESARRPGFQGSSRDHHFLRGARSPCCRRQHRHACRRPCHPGQWLQLEGPGRLGRRLCHGRLRPCLLYTSPSPRD